MGKVTGLPLTCEAPHVCILCPFPANHLFDSLPLVLTHPAPGTRPSCSSTVAAMLLPRGLGTGRSFRLDALPPEICMAPSLPAQVFAQSCFLRMAFSVQPESITPEPAPPLPPLPGSPPEPPSPSYTLGHLPFPPACLSSPSRMSAPRGKGFLFCSLCSPAILLSDQAYG